MPRKVPNTVKTIFYADYQDPAKYTKLIIKDDKSTKKLRNIFDNNSWNLKDKAKALKIKMDTEQNSYFNGWLNEVYLLDYKTVPKINTIDKDDFYKMIYKDENTTERNELNFINVYKAWINNIFVNRSNEKTLNWVVLNQNEVLYGLLKYRSDNNQSLETLRKDLNLLLKLLKLAVGERVEIVNKYKSLNQSLSKIYEMKDKMNEITELEETKFVSWLDLNKLKDKLYNEWLNEYEGTTLDKYKNERLRNKNIIALLLNFYINFPMRLEIMDLEFVNSEKEAKSKQAAIFIKNKKSIWLYFNSKKKGHPDINFDLNDPVLKSFNKENINNLIEHIIESAALYPREFLFINSSNNKYTAKSLQRALYELLPDKNIGVNSIRSAFVSYWWNKLNRIQIDRVAYIMRTSVATMHQSYYKQDKSEPLNLESVKKEEPAPAPIIKEDVKPIVIKEIKLVKKLTDEQREEKHEKRLKYHKSFYNKNKEQMKEQAKINEKANYWRRYVTEARSNAVNFDNIKAATIIKYKLHNEEGRIWSDFDPNY